MIYKYNVLQAKVYFIKMDLIYDKSYFFINTNSKQIIYDY